MSKKKAAKRNGRCIGYRVAMAGDGGDWYLDAYCSLSTVRTPLVSRRVASAILTDIAETDPDYAKCFRIVRVMRRSVR